MMYSSPKSSHGGASATKQPEKSTIDRVAMAINDSTDGLAKGSKVWFKQSDQEWLPGELKSAPDDTSTVQLEDGSTVQAEIVKILPANPKVQEGIPDLTHLSYLNEPGILYNLQYRYQQDAIYTFAGPVLIALNPCKSLPLYTTEVANQYKAGARDIINNLPPHIYLVAANAFRKMVREKTSQSLIVNGESGAGKTETTKKAMQYFATLAGGTGVEDQVLETNPILEAFGNAKTLRNHNSSRFGKLIQIHFNQSNHICGACIRTYLLEKSRVVHQLQGERSYHIFYQLVRGASDKQRAAWRLPPAKEAPHAFRFLSQSGCMDIAGVNDAKEFHAVCEALADIGIGAEAQDALFSLLAGVLWLGNLDFEPNLEDTTNDSTLVVEGDALASCCELLGLEPARLKAALTSKKIITPSEVVVKQLNVEESRDCRDALAKAIYAAVFNWIVEQINVKLDTGKKGSGLSISILDIYGFEQFVRNSFEQLCINYANERLQQQFTRHLFTLEQEEYESEGIDWTKVEFIDNQECVDVIEMTPPKGLGVLAVLESQCRFPKATDDTFLAVLKDALASSSHFGINPRTQRDFMILHYAGQVQYNVTGFLDKNKDAINNDLVDLMLASGQALLPRLGGAVRDELAASSRSGQTVGGRFSGQLKDLIQSLDATGLHFVRCIKPNAELLPDKFESVMTLHQLRCCGVLEVARVARAGFPTRYTHTQFAERYEILLPPQEQGELSSMESALSACRQLVQKFGLTSAQYQLGRTKIFFRPGVLGYLEDMWARMQASTLAIQAMWRMHRARAVYQAQRQAAAALQAAWRARVDRLAYARLRQLHRASLVIQRLWRGYYLRSRFLELRRSALIIQAAFRRWRFSKRVKRRLHEREKREFMARLEQESFDNLRKEFGYDMETVKKALRAYKAQMEAEAAGIVMVQAQAAPAAPLPPPPPAIQLPLSPLAEGAARGLPSPTGSDPASRPPPAVVAERFEAVKEMSSTLERVQLENVKLAKQLQLEKSLKDRYQHKYEEQNMTWLEQIRVLQDYIQQVRAAIGDHKLPPLPSNLHGTPHNIPAAPVRSPSPGNVAATVAAANAMAAASASAATPGAATRHTVGGVPLPGLANPSAASTPVAAPRSVSADAAIDAGAHGAARAGSLTRGTGLSVEVAEPAGEMASESGLAAAMAASSPVGVVGARGTVPAIVDVNSYMAHHHSDDDDDDSGGAGDQRRQAAARSQQEASKAAAAANSGRPASPSASDAASSSLHATPLAAGAAAGSAATLAAAAAADRTPASSTAGTAPAGHRGSSSQAGAAPHPVGPSPAVAPVSLPPNATASQKYVANLMGELDKVSQVLADDVQFIREVREGSEVALDMDPGLELGKLKKKFDIWKREFKDKLKTTEEVLRRIDKLERRAKEQLSSSAARAMTRMDLANNLMPTPSTSVSRSVPALGGVDSNALPTSSSTTLSGPQAPASQYRVTSANGPSLPPAQARALQPGQQQQGSTPTKAGTAGADAGGAARKRGSSFMDKLFSKGH